MTFSSRERLALRPLFSARPELPHEPGPCIACSALVLRNARLNGLCFTAARSHSPLHKEALNALVSHSTGTLTRNEVKLNFYSRSRRSLNVHP